MFKREYKNGKLTLFNNKAVRGYDGRELLINETTYSDVFVDMPLGRIERFIIQDGYIKAIVKGVRYDIDSLYFND